MSKTTPSLGYIYLLPTNTQRAIVKYYPKWLISAMLPAETRTVGSNKYDYNEDILVKRQFTIDFPAFILSHSWKKPWVSYPEHTAEYFQLHAYDAEATNAIKALPYRLANIYTSGTICFGEVGLEGLPKNLRQANNYFWGTPFNDDGSIFYDQHARVCETKEHEYYNHIEWEDVHQCDPSWKGHSCACPDVDPLTGAGHRSSLSFTCACVNNTCDCPCTCACCQEICDCHCTCECCMGVCACACACNLLEPYFNWFGRYNEEFKTRPLMVKTRYFCGDKYFATSDPTSALFIAPSSPSLEKIIPTSSWRNDAQGSKVVIGVATRNTKSWDIDLGAFQFSIAETDVKVL